MRRPGRHPAARSRNVPVRGGHLSDVSLSSLAICVLFTGVNYLCYLGVNKRIPLNDCMLLKFEFMDCVAIILG